MKTNLLLVSTTLALVACSKPFPVPQELYTEYQGIVCKIASGGLTPADLTRQMQLNAMFQQKLQEGGAPSADWVATHAGKLAQVMDVKNCDKVSASSTPGGTAAGTTDTGFAKFDGTWMFSAEKTKAANTEGDEMQKALVQGTITGLEIRLAKSAGMKVEGGRVQDGEGRCTFEGAPDAKGFTTCVVPSDRSIYGKFMVDGQGDLVASSFAGLGVSLVFEKRK